MNALGEMLVRGVSIDEIARRLRRDKIEVCNKVARGGPGLPVELAPPRTSEPTRYPQLVRPSGDRRAGCHSWRAGAVRCGWPSTEFAGASPGRKANLLIHPDGAKGTFSRDLLSRGLQYSPCD
jgi:hypothetical protein